MTYNIHCENSRSCQRANEQKGRRQIESLIAGNALKTKGSTDGSSLVQTCNCCWCPAWLFVSGSDSLKPALRVSNKRLRTPWSVFLNLTLLPLISFFCHFPLSSYLLEFNFTLVKMASGLCLVREAVARIQSLLMSVYFKHTRDTCYKYTYICMYINILVGGEAAGRHMCLLVFLSCMHKCVNWCTELRKVLPLRKLLSDSLLLLIVCVSTSFCANVCVVVLSTVCRWEQGHGAPPQGHCY